MEQILAKLRKFVYVHSFGGMSMSEDYNELVQLFREYERTHQPKGESRGQQNPT